MFCENCGTKINGETCPKCSTNNQASKKALNFDIAGFFQNLKFVIPVLAVLLVGAVSSGVLANQANAQVIKHTKLQVEALGQVESSNASASTFDDLAARARVSRDQCYINWFCSATLYGKWVDLVNTDESLAASMRSAAAESQAKADSEKVIVAKAIQDRTNGFIASGLFSALLIASLVLFLIFRKKKAATQL